MIEVIIRHKESGAELGRIEIEQVTEDEWGDTGDYAVSFGVERIKSVGTHRRAMFGFPRKRYNVLGLLRQALNTLEPAELSLDEGADIDGDGLPKRKRLPWNGRT